MKKENSLNRRNFLKLSAAGAAGLCVAPAITNAFSKNGTLAVPVEKKIITRTLGKTGLTVPVISSGAIPDENENLIRAILKSGIVHIDTAHGYSKGKNEEALGKILKEFNPKDFIIATKINEPTDKTTGLYTAEATTESFLEKLDISLKRLGLETVDILYLHAVSRKESVMYEPLMKALQKAKEQGKIRFTGISTHKNEPECIQAAIDSKFYDVVLTSINYQLPHHVDIVSAVNKAGEAGLGVVAMKVCAGNFLDKGQKKQINKKAALKWVLQNENVHTAIMSFETFDMIDEYWSVMENLTLTEEEKKSLEYDDSQGSLFCPGCEKCTRQCRAGLPIPEIMRAYMYTYGYRRLDKAHELITSLNLPSNICGDCDFCTVNCSKGFNVAERIRDVSRLRDVPSDFIV